MAEDPQRAEAIACGSEMGVLTKNGAGGWGREGVQGGGQQGVWGRILQQSVHREGLFPTLFP